MASKDEVDPIALGRAWLQRHGWWLNPLISLGLFLLVLNAQRGNRADLNATAISLTTLEIFLVTIAFFGFWVIRREAIAAAEETAAKLFNERYNEESRSTPPQEHPAVSGAALPAVDDAQEESSL